MRNLLVGAASVALLASPALAATVCVNPAGSGGCFSSVQAAVNAATAGDTVTVSPGVYFEAVTIPAGKNGLTIAGASKVNTIVDAGPPASGDGFYVQSDSVTIKNIAVRHTASGFNGINVAGNNALITGVKVTGALGMGIGVGTGFTGAQLLNNEVRHNGFGIVVQGNGTVDTVVVQGNTVNQHQYGIYVTASPGATLRSNRVSLGLYGVVAAASPGSLLTQNTVRSAYYGVYGDGENVTVTSNRSDALLIGAINGCTTGCTTGVLANNVVSGATYGTYGMHALGLSVTANRAATTIIPVVLQSNGATVSANVATGGGLNSSGLGCFLVQGDGNTLISNISNGCGGIGFLVDGDNNTLTTNSSTSANIAGYLVDSGTGNTFTGNRATLAAGEGFALVNAPVNTTLTSNSAVGQRVDYCHEGDTGTTLTGNTFGTTSTVCDVQE